MKRTRNKLTDTDDDMDHLPLKYITVDYKRNKSINELRRYSVHACEFCEKMFENKYDHLIHNAKHIIIPLIKMLPRHCTQCDTCCFSEEEMNDHMLVKHNIFIKPKDFKNNNDKLKVSDTFKLEVEHIEDESNEDETPLNCLIKKEKDVVGIETENILKTFMMSCKVDIEKFVPRWRYESDEDNKDVGTNKEVLKNHIAEFNPHTKVNYMSNGINFKNKIVELIPSPKNNNTIRSDTNNFKNRVANSDHSVVLSDVKDNIVILPSEKKEIVTDYSINQDSTHFDDLIKPGIFYCKRCYKRFPNRFEVIVHEIVHFNVKLIAPKSFNSNSKTQSAKIIPLASTTTSKFLICHKCNEEILDKEMHEKTCVKYHCADCGQGFNEKDLVSAHLATCIGLAVVMCDTCLYLRKRPKHVRYYGIIRFNNMEVKQLCRWCGKLCNEMSQVTLVNRQRLADRIQFEGDVGEHETSIDEYVAVKSENKNDQVKKECTRVKERKKKPGHKILSNRERLKLIQIRLKSMKK